MIMKALANNLPTGDQRHSIHSPRTIVLMKYEALRRKYNRINNERLSLYTFLHLHYSKRFNTPLKDTMIVARLIVEIVQFNKSRHYLNNSRYNNNFKF